MTKSKATKPIFIFLAVLIAVLLLSVLQYVIHCVNNPVDQPGPDIVGNGCLIWGAGPDESTVIPVSASVTRKHYVFGNHEDGLCVYQLQADGREWSDDGRWIYWAALLDEMGAAVNISKDEDFSFFYSSADMDVLIFGVCDVSRILDPDLNPNLQGKKGVLVLPADGSEDARGAVQKASGAGYAGESIKEWLAENHLEDCF